MSASSLSILILLSKTIRRLDFLYILKNDKKVNFGYKP